ncbi:nuclear transport factor 2 family protein [Pseudomonas sp. BN515]|uniref:nuclear transport factor 2 family protein n=1 Tax=Pseudomonas sp. BN515 TaxID=2567892 RepID=UPI002454E914|nr:nuclear transport factor 2 family protein [Pseudomonas sp. BN515]MDH4874447.1 hypothetical protein [Pseudomonas sp. BN515]
MLNQPKLNAQNATNRSLQLVLDFVQLAFCEKQPRAAFERFVAPDYVQHNPHVPTDGAAASLSFLEGFQAQFPALSYEVKRAASSDDLAFVHAHVRTNADDPGAALVDIFRIENGRIAEHWDVLQSIDPQSPNPRSSV